jgi:WD40 repeat protein
VFGPGAVEGYYPGRLSEKPRWDWIDLRGFSAWRVLTFTEALDDGFTKLVASLYEVPDRFLPVLRREERRRRQRAIFGFAVAGLSVVALTTTLAIWAVIERGNAVSALRNALITKAQMSVRLATEELEKKDPDRALATALAGVETPSKGDMDAAVVADSITVIANSIANATIGANLRDHSDAVLQVALGPDGRSAITVGADEKAILWTGENGRPLRPIGSTMLGGAVFAIAQGSGLVASGSPSGQVHFWDSHAPEFSPPPFDFGERLLALTFSEDGKSIAALGIAGKLAVWDVVNNRLVRAISTPVQDASTIAFGPNCNCWVVGTSTGDLLAWSPDKDPLTVRGASGRMVSGVFGREGQFLFATEDGRVWLTSAPSWPMPVNIGRHDSNIIAVAASPDGRLAATTSMDGIAWIWNLTKRDLSKRITSTVNMPLSSVAFSPIGNSVAFGHGNGKVAIWDLGDANTDPSEVLVMRGHTSAVLDLAFSSDGNWLASASLDRTARVWRSQTARRPRILQAHQGAAFHAVSGGGHYIISGGNSDKKVQIWKGPNWEPVKSIPLEHVPTALAVSDDGKRAFIGNDKGEILQWDTVSSVPTLLSPGGNGHVASVAISPDEKTLAAIGIHAKLRICAVGTSPCEELPLVGSGHSVAFSSDGRLVGATSGVEGRIGLALVKDLKTNEVTRLEGHTERVSSIRFDQQGRRAITVSWDGTARIWDLTSGQELVRFVEPKGSMSTAGFSPDGKWVATTWNGKNLRLWAVPNQTDSTTSIVLKADKSILISDSANFAQIHFGLSGAILAGSVTNGDVHLWHMPTRTLRVVLGGGFPISDTYFHPDGLQITAMTRGGRLLSWGVLPVLGLSDASLLAAARSMLPLSGSLIGKLTEPSIASSDSSETCVFFRRPNVGLPPQNLSGAARARQQVSIPPSCNSSLAGKGSRALREGSIAEVEGDFRTAFQKFNAASTEGELAAEISLGDLSFIDSLSGADGASARDHYTRARERGVTNAASRLGWLVLADPTANNVAQAKEYFEEGVSKGEADGFAGLAWINERHGNSSQDVEAAFSNYIEAQYAYERDGDLAFAQEIAERRATLARLIAPEQLAKLFISARLSIVSSYKLK